MTPDEKAHDMGLDLDTAAAPLANYVPTVRCGNLLFVSGQLPLSAGVLAPEHKGKVGREVARRPHAGVLKGLRPELREAQPPHPPRQNQTRPRRIRNRAPINLQTVQSLRRSLPAASRPQLLLRRLRPFRRQGPRRPSHVPSSRHSLLPQAARGVSISAD